MKKVTRITGKMTVEEAIKNFPETAFTFIRYGLHCVSCPMAVGENVETIEEAAKLHRIDFKKFLSDLNKTINPIRKSSASSLITKRRRISNEVR